MEGVLWIKTIDKRSAKDKTVFTKARQETLADIITVLENVIFVLKFLCDPTT